MEALIILIGVVGAIAGLILYSTLSWGFVCFKFWYWFMLPVFTELPHVTFWQCVGLMFFIALFKNNNVVKNEDRKFWSQMVIGPWLTLFIGYLMHIIFIA